MQQTGTAGRPTSSTNIPAWLPGTLNFVGLVIAIIGGSMLVSNNTVAAEALLADRAMPLSQIFGSEATVRVIGWIMMLGGFAGMFGGSWLGNIANGYSSPFARVSGVTLTLVTLRYLIIVMVVAGAFNTLVGAPKYEAELWVNLIAAGLTQGSIYALIALGYTLVYGILLMINFAHGEIFMAGAFTALFLAQWMSGQGFLNPEIYPIWVTYLCIVILIAFAGLISTLVAILLERVAYRPLRGAPRLVPLITAIGASFFLQYTFRGFYGSDFQAYPEFPALDWRIPVGRFEIPFVQVFVIVTAIILMFALYYLVEFTKVGKAMRAVSENKEVSRLMGINIDRIIVVTFAIGGMLAGAAGVINGLYRPQGVGYTMGFFPGIKAFTAAVLGGIGSVPGAMIGGLLLGVFEAIGPNLILDGLGIPGANQLKDAIAFTMLVLILIFRPQGIMGEKLAETKA